MPSLPCCSLCPEGTDLLCNLCEKCFCRRHFGTGQCSTCEMLSCNTCLQTWSKPVCKYCEEGKNIRKSLEFSMQLYANQSLEVCDIRLVSNLARAPKWLEEIRKNAVHDCLLKAYKNGATAFAGYLLDFFGNSDQWVCENFPRFEEMQAEENGDVFIFLEKLRGVANFLLNLEGATAWFMLLRKWAVEESFDMFWEVIKDTPEQEWNDILVFAIKEKDGTLASRFREKFNGSIPNIAYIRRMHENLLHEAGNTESFDWLLDNGYVLLTCMTFFFLLLLLDMILMVYASMVPEREPSHSWQMV